MQNLIRIDSSCEYNKKHFWDYPYKIDCFLDITRDGWVGVKDSLQLLGSQESCDKLCLCKKA